jgi:hypothetical protein
MAARAFQTFGRVFENPSRRRLQVAFAAATPGAAGARSIALGMALYPFRSR